MLLDDLLARMESAAPKPIAVDLGGALGTLYILPLMVADLQAPTATDAEALSQGESTARNVARLLCDETGERFYKPGATDPEQQASNARLIAAVLKLQPAHLNAIQDAMTNGGVTGAKNG